MLHLVRARAIAGNIGLLLLYLRVARRRSGLLLRHRRG